MDRIEELPEMERHESAVRLPVNKGKDNASMLRVLPSGKMIMDKGKGGKQRIKLTDVREERRKRSRAEEEMERRTRQPES